VPVLATTRRVAHAANGLRLRRTIRVGLLMTLTAASALSAGSAAAADGGSRLWVRRYDAPGAGAVASATSVVVSPDGSKVFVAGFCELTNWGYAVVAYDALTGTQLWSRNGLGDVNVVYALAVSPDGSTVFMAGVSLGRTLDYGTVAYDAATGTRRWARRYDGPAGNNDVPTAIAVSADGSRVIVAGSSQNSTYVDDFATVAYRASTGATAWTQRYSGIGNGDDEARAMAVAPDGSAVFVTGSSEVRQTGRLNYATVAYDQRTGAHLGTLTYNGPTRGQDEAFGVAVSPDSSKVFVTGYSDGEGTGVDYATAAYQVRTGKMIWNARYDGPAGSSDSALAIAASPDGSKVFVTGASSGDSSGDGDYATVAYGASDGAELWSERYDGAGFGGAANSIGASPDGSKVFVTGWSVGETSDYVTIAYDADTGATLWGDRYDSPAHATDEAHALAVSPDGSKLYVTGFVGAQGPLEFGTVAYEA
jgi:WD40 repeat protein